MSVWLTIPSAKPVAECNEILGVWRRMGYRTAIFRDSEPVGSDLCFVGQYQGYAVTVNELCRQVMEHDPDAQWMIAAGDDIEPDQTKDAETIARECVEHFSGTFGVMQPTGDPWADAHGRMIERIAGSPWIGREFAQRSYGGNGPYWHGYWHCFLDNEIMDIATLLGVFWQRPDLCHLHRHWARESKPMPQYLARANSPSHWEQSLRLYQNRKSAGFPGHEPLPSPCSKAA